MHSAFLHLFFPKTYYELEIRRLLMSSEDWSCVIDGQQRELSDCRQIVHLFFADLSRITSSYDVVNTTVTYKWPDNRRIMVIHSNPRIISFYPFTL